MNTSKLVLHNLTQPMNKRMSARDLQERTRTFAMRGRVAAIRSAVQVAIADKLVALREREAFINSGATVFRNML